MELIKITPDEFGIETKEATKLTSGLEPVLIERKDLVKQYEQVSKLEVNEENIPQFKELRLRIRDNRTKGINQWHSNAKNYFLRGGQFVDAIKRKEIAVNEAMEEKLMEAEKFLEIQEQKRLELLQKERAEKLSEYVEDAHERDLVKFDDEEFEAVLAMKKKEHEDRIEAERKEEEARKEQERKEKLRWERAEIIKPYYDFFEENVHLAELSKDEFEKLVSDLKEKKQAYLAEQEKIRKDNERLQKEREEERRKAEAERKAREAEEAKRKAKEEADRKAHEEQLRKEREAREKLEREAREREQAEKAKIEAERKAKIEAEKAPVKKRLTEWVDSFELPELAGKNHEKADLIREKFASFQAWAKKEIKDI